MELGRQGREVPLSGSHAFDGRPTIGHRRGNELRALFPRSAVGRSRRSRAVHAGGDRKKRAWAMWASAASADGPAICTARSWIKNPEILLNATFGWIHDKVPRRAPAAQALLPALDQTRTVGLSPCPAASSGCCWAARWS